MRELRFVEQDFIEMMNEIGQYGFNKHGEKSYQFLRENNLPLNTERLSSCLQHIKDHADAYSNGELHDKFQDLEHQLGAIAYNAMMEFVRLRESKRQSA